MSVNSSVISKNNNKCIFEMTLALLMRIGGHNLTVKSPLLTHKYWPTVVNTRSDIRVNELY